MFVVHAPPLCAPIRFFLCFRAPTTPSDHRAGTPDALIDPLNELLHLKMPPTVLKKLDSERITAMAMGATVLAAHVAALGEGLGRVERRNPALRREARNGYETASSMCAPRFSIV